MTFVIDGVYQPGDAGMHKSGVADDRHHLAFNASFLHAKRLSDARAHAGGGIQDVERRVSPQCIAADVPGDNQLRLHRLFGIQEFRALAQAVQDGVDAGMGTAGAKQGRTSGKAGGGRQDFLRIGQEAGSSAVFRDDARVQLADQRDEFLAGDRNAHRLYIILQKRVQLLDNDKPVHAGGELFNHFHRQGPGHAQLKERRLRKDLPRVLVSHAARHDTQLAAIPDYLIEGKRLRIFGERKHSFFHGGVAG